MIWHLVKNSSFKPVFCLIGLAAPFYAKVHLSLYHLFYTRLHLLPTALWLYVDTLLKKEGDSGFCIIFSALCSFLDVLLNWLRWLSSLENKVQNNLESQTVETLVFYNKY